MLTKEFKITNKTGLQVKPASVLASNVGDFKSTITIFFDGNEYNAKSIINMLAADIKENDIIKVSIVGEDKEEAMSKFEELINSGFTD